MSKISNIFFYYRHEDDKIEIFLADLLFLPNFAQAAVMGILPFLTSCEEESKVEHPGLWLSADKTTISADGEDMVTFTVTLDDVDVTSQCSFCSQENCYVSNTFSTTTAGEYVFHATYLETNENSANEVTITAQ